MLQKNIFEENVIFYGTDFLIFLFFEYFRSIILNASWSLFGIRELSHPAKMEIWPRKKKNILKQMEN